MIIIHGWPGYLLQWGINMYFRLNSECYFIRGAQCGAIYDLIEGNIYSLDPQESEIIQKCENNAIINPSDIFLVKLKEQCLGNFYEKPVYIEKIRFGSPIFNHQPGSPPILHRAFLEINNTCDKSCWYCGFNGIHRSNGCYGCNKWDESGEELRISRWKQIIDELSDLECQSLFITGGDLTHAWNKTLDIINYAQSSFDKIFICINKNNLNENFIRDIQFKAIPIIQTDSATNIDDENFFLVTVDIDTNFEIPEKKKSVIFDYISRDFCSPNTRKILHPSKNIPKTDIFRFSHNKKFHPCLGNSLTITWNGEVLPCPMLRTCSAGNIQSAPLYSIFLKNTGHYA